MSTIESLVGVVASVDDDHAGSDAREDHDAGALVLQLLDAADFAETGGQAEVLGTVVEYAAADLETDTLTLTMPLPEAVPEGAPVRVWPLAPVRVVTLMVDSLAGEGMRAVVPQSLLDQIPPGLRDPVASESVTVALVDGAWTVRDVVAAPDATVKEGRFRLGPDDEVAGGLQEDGSADFTETRTESLKVAGRSLDEHLAPLVEGLGRFATPVGETYGPTTVDMAIVEVVADVPANSTFILDVHGWLRAQEGTLSLLRCSYTHAAAGTTPPRPGGGDTEILPGLPVMHHTSWSGVMWRWTLGIGPEDRRVRALIWASADPYGREQTARAFTVLPSILRLRGASGFAGVIRGTPGGGDDPAPAPPLASRTRRFDLGPHSLWVGSTRAVSGYRMGDVQAGRSASGQLWDTAILMPTTARSFIAESEEIVSARVRLAQSVYPTTIRPHVGTIQTTNITGTRSELAPRNIGQGSHTYTPAQPSGWTNLAATTLTALKAGDPGLWIPNLGTGQTVGRFHGPGASGALRPQIEITTRSRT